MKDQGDDCSLFGPIINDVWFFLNGLIHSKFSHVQREGNLAAHHLAHMSIGSSQEFVWFEEPLDLIQDILVEEVLINFPFDCSSKDKFYCCAGHFFPLTGLKSPATFLLRPNMHTILWLYVF